MNVVLLGESLKPSVFRKDFHIHFTYIVSKVRRQWEGVGTRLSKTLKADRTCEL